jgi:hypothetical protein
MTASTRQLVHMPTGGNFICKWIDGEIHIVHKPTNESAGTIINSKLFGKMLQERRQWIMESLGDH